MSKVMIDDARLLELANAIRQVNGETKLYTPAEMAAAIETIMDSITYILVDADGNEVPAVYVDSEVVFTATENDIRAGSVAVTDSGVVTGTKVIPAYQTTEGSKVVTSGSEFAIYIPNYNYTKLQAVIHPVGTTAVDRVVIDDTVYPVNSSTAEATVTIDETNGRIDFGITNTSDTMYVIRYFTFREEY